MKFAIHKAITTALSLCLTTTCLQAQVRKPTQEELATAPPQFRKEVTGDKALTDFERPTTPEGIYPETGPRDFTGAYTRGNFQRSAQINTAESAERPQSGLQRSEAAALSQQQRKLGSGEPGEICTPGTTIGFGGGYSTHVFMTADRLTIVSEENHRIRRIYINGQHQPDAPASYNGDSIAHWDSDTLVIETTNVLGQENQVQVERVRKIEGGRTLEIITRVDGGEPRTTLMAWRPDLFWVEDFCEDFGEAYGEGYL